MGEAGGQSLLRIRCGRLEVSKLWSMQWTALTDDKLEKKPPNNQAANSAPNPNASPENENLMCVCIFALSTTTLDHTALSHLGEGV